MQTFPIAVLFLNSFKASIVLSREYVLCIWGFNFPSEANSSIASKFFFPISGSLLPYSPPLTPTTEKPFIRGMFAPMLGIRPEVNPMTNKRPFQAIQRIDSSNTSPPTGS